MKHKIRAASLHLLISIVLVACVLTLVFFVCYPDPYYKVMEAGKLLLVLTGVDIGLGPLTTFVIFNPAKKRLKLELACVGMLQLAALAYGASVFYAARPVYVVFAEHEYTLVSAFEIPDSLLRDLKYPALPNTGPKLVGARLVDSRAARKVYYDEVLVKYHVGLPRMPQYYVPYASMVAEVKAEMRSLDRLLEGRSPKERDVAAETLDKAVARSGMARDTLAWVPLAQRDKVMAAMVRRDDAALVTVLPIGPP